MKKIFLILSAIMTTTVVHATQMCARRNTTVIPLDAAVARRNGGGVDVFSLEWMWASYFDFGTTYGFGTCLSAPEILEMTPGWTDTVNMPQIIPTDNEDIRGRSGIYTASDGTEHERKYCYSKLIHPMSSQWVRAQIYNNAATCTGVCISVYGAAIVSSGSGDTRTITMYNSVGGGLEEIDDAEYDESINLN